MEQNGTIGLKTSKYMLDENQSLRINFEPFVKTYCTRKNKRFEQWPPDGENI